MSKEWKQMNFRITEEEHKKIMKYCERIDITASQLIRIYFKKLINEQSNNSIHTI